MSTFTQSVNDASPPLLLIDDDLSLSRLIRDYCETDGLTVTSAGTGEEGIYLRSKSGSNSSFWMSCSPVSMDSRC